MHTHVLTSACAHTRPFAHANSRISMCANSFVGAGEGVVGAEGTKPIPAASLQGRGPPCSQGWIPPLHLRDLGVLCPTVQAQPLGIG